MTVPRVYTLGNVPLVSLLGYCIAKLPGQGTIPNVVMLLRDQAALDRFLRNDSKVTVSSRRLILDQVQTMASCSVPKYSDGSVATIDNLVIGEKNWMDSTSLLRRYRGSFTHNSNIFLVNPSFRILDSLMDPNISKKLLNERPRIFWGWTGGMSNNDLVLKEDEFQVSLRKQRFGMHITELPMLNQDTLEYNGVSNDRNSMLDILDELGNTTINGSIDIKIEHKPFNDQFISYIENYLIESMVEPLCLLNECNNYGELLSMDNLISFVNPLLLEKIIILKKAFPFLTHATGNDLVLDSRRLSNQILERVKTLSKTRSWAYTQLKILKKNELFQLIDFLPYISRKHKMHMPKNTLLNQLVKGKANIYCAKKLS